MKENLVQLGLGKAVAFAALKYFSIGKEDSRGGRLCLQEEYDEMTQAATSERRRLAAEVEETVEQERLRLARAAREERVRADVRSSEAAFLCGDCQKQYKTVTEMENHLSSYDHHHRKRLRDMQRQERLASASDEQRLKRRRGEQQQEELMLQRRIQQAAAEASAALSSVIAATPSSTPAPLTTSTPSVTTQKIGFALVKGMKGKKPGKKPCIGVSSAFSQPSGL
jgi:hypothetical protein